MNTIFDEKQRIIYFVDYIRNRNAKKMERSRGQWTWRSGIGYVSKRVDIAVNGRFGVPRHRATSRYVRIRRCDKRLNLGMTNNTAENRANQCAAAHITFINVLSLKGDCSLQHWLGNVVCTWCNVIQSDWIFLIVFF